MHRGVAAAGHEGHQLCHSPPPAGLATPFWDIVPPNGKTYDIDRVLLHGPSTSLAFVPSYFWMGPGGRLNLTRVNFKVRGGRDVVFCSPHEKMTGWGGRRACTQADLCLMKCKALFLEAEMCLWPATFSD